MGCNCNKRNNQPYTPTTTNPVYVVRDKDGTHEYPTLEEAQAYKNTHPTAGVIVKRN